MNVFVIPSWYPSKSNPIYGTFVEEQLNMMSQINASIHFGVSLWGQGDEPFLLYARSPIKSMQKSLTSHKEDKRVIRKNLIEYFSPAFTWTQKWRQGNMHGIIKANMRNLERFISDQGRPDIIHVQASYPGAWIAKLIKERMGIPYVVTLRMSPFPFYQFLKQGRLTKELMTVLNGAHQLIATSSSLSKRAQTLGLGHVSIVHNPVNTDFFKPVDRIQKKAQESKLLSVGRLEPQKGFDILIRALSHLEGEVTLDILGEGSQRPELESLITAADLQRKVTLHGQKTRSEVRDFMQRSDLYVLSSRHETFGNVLLEAMSCGIPAVATDCGGPSDIIRDQTGLLCPAENINALYVAIGNALSRSWDYQDIRQNALDRFGKDQFTEKMIALYQRAIDEV